MLQSSAKSTRSAGIEYLRILSMFLITVTHTCTQGGILDTLQPFTTNYYVAWSIMAFSYVAVNCYALISGYVGIASAFRFYRLPSLWLKVIFYTVAITACFAVFSSDDVGMTDWIEALTPATSGTYWYFSAYFALFFFTPFLNRLINNLSQKGATLLIAVSLLLFSILPTIRHTDPFVTGEGYSFLWLAILYLTGAYIRRYELLKKLRPAHFLLLAIAGFSITAGSKFLIEYICHRLLGTVAGGGVLMSYISPSVLLFAIGLLGFFVRLPEKFQKGNSVLFAISASTFGVYIIHAQPFLKHTFMREQFTQYATYSPLVMAGAILGTALTIYVVCTAIDIIQSLLFKWWKVDQRTKCLSEKIQNIYDHI